MATPKDMRHARKHYAPHIADRLCARMLNGLDYEGAVYAESKYGTLREVATESLTSPRKSRQG